MKHVTTILSRSILLAFAVCAACGGGGSGAAREQAALRVQAAALEEIAEALLFVEKRGGYLGARFVANLAKSAEGEPLVRIYAGSPAPAIASNELVDRVIGRNQGGVHFLFSDTHSLRPDLQRMLVALCREQFSGLDFELTRDPARANVFIFETTLALNPQRPRSGEEGREYDAYTMAASSDPPITIIALNTGDPQAFGATVAGENRDQIEGVLLNEMINALGTYDLQALDFASFSEATQRWGAMMERDYGAAFLDSFTITDSGSREHSPELLEMDLMVVERILEEAALLEEARQAGSGSNERQSHTPGSTSRPGDSR